MEKLQPKLRFTEFREELFKSHLGEIATFSKGKGISKNDITSNGKNECIRYGELYTTYGEVIHQIVSKTNVPKTSSVLSEFNDIIIPSSGETQLDIAKSSCVLKSDVILGGDLNIIKTKNNGVFFSYYLNSAKKEEIAKMAQGNSVVHLYSHQLSSLVVSFPSLPEQTKIASFLTTVDKKIAGLKKQLTLLERYKKGVMQKIFSQKLRFQDENGNDFPDWEEKKLGEICNIKRGASPRPITDKKWFDNNSKIGWVRISDISKSNKYLEKTEQYFSPSAIDKSRFVKKGNMIMSICATLGKPIYTNIDVCIPDSFIVFEKLSLEKEYFFYYLDFIQLNWYKYGQPGTQVNLNSEIVSNETIPVPSNFEQQKIASFLSSIDEKIIKCQGQIKTMENWKKGLLQQMFV